jgi:hypothetical protein
MSYLCLTFFSLLILCSASKAQFGRNVHFVGSYLAGRYIYDVAVQDDYAYCADSYGLSVWDISDIAQRHEVARQPTPGGATRIGVRGNRAYICEGSRGLATFDIADPENPHMINYLDYNPGGYGEKGIIIRDNILFQWSSIYLRILSLDDPDHPELISQTGLPQITDFCLYGDFAFISRPDDQYNLMLMDISDLEHPEIIDRIEGPFLSSIAVEGDLLVGCGNYRNNQNLLLYNVSDPENPELVSELPIEEIEDGLYVSDTLVYCNGSPNGSDMILYVVNVSNREEPEIINEIDEITLTEYPTPYQNLLFIPSRTGFEVVNFEEPVNPYYLESVLLTRHQFMALVVDDDAAFIKDLDLGFAAIGLNDLRHPNLISEISQGDRGRSTAYAIEKYQDLVICSQLDRREGLGLYDMSDPANARLVNYLYILYARTYKSTMYTLDEHLYFAGMFYSIINEPYVYKNLIVVDMTNPDEPEIVERREDTNEFTEYSCLNGDLLYQVVIEELYGLATVLVYSLAEPGAPELIGEWNEGWYGELMVYNGYAYVHVNQYVFSDTIAIYSVENPVEPEFIRNYSNGSGLPVDDMCSEGNIIYLSLRNGVYGFACMSIEDPENPEIVGYYDTPSDVEGFECHNGYLFTAEKHELGIYDCAELHGIWDIQTSEESHNFGYSPPDSTAIWELILTNAAGQSVEVLNVIADSAVFAVEFDDTLTLEPDEEAIIPVSFTPTEQRPYTGQLTILTERRDVVVELSGTGVYNSVADDDILPLEFGLFPAYPNPFNSTTTITYGLGKPATARIAIYDLTGREIVTLVNDKLEAGHYNAVWSAAEFPSGLYICRMEAGGFCQSRKLVLVR